MFCCFVMLVCTVILLCCVLWCGFEIFLYSSVQKWFSLLQWHKVLSSTPFLHQRQPAFIFTCVHNRHIPRRSLVITPMTHIVSYIHDTRSAEIFSLSQCTHPKVFLTTQTNPLTYLYTPPTQSTHVFSYNANDPKRFLKLYYYYPVSCIPLL